jgi:hypothetical protein
LLKKLDPKAIIAAAATATATAIAEPTSTVDPTAAAVKEEEMKTESEIVMGMEKEENESTDNNCTGESVPVSADQMETVPVDGAVQMESTATDTTALQLSLESEPFNSNAVSLAFGYSPAVLESLYKKVLIGFGRNAIGRFSVAALYDEQTGELRCEKKYMTVKFAIKRGRRSHAEYAMSCVTTAPTATAGTTMAMANTLIPSASYGRAVETIASSRVQRPHKPNQFFTAIVGTAAALDPVDGTSLNSNDVAETKRPRRTLSFSRSSSLSRFADSQRERDGSMTDSGLRDDVHGKPLSNKRKHSSNNSGNSVPMDPATILSIEPNALVGVRNPDNDDPLTDYRDAFMDVDSGEIYEGQWMFGFRHGLGICLYCDGLMYEGFWVKGREHGKVSVEVVVGLIVVELVVGRCSTDLFCSCYYCCL